MKKRPTLPGPIFPTLHIFSYNFLLHNYSLRDPIYICPPNFFIFVTHICDSLSRLPFATPFRDPHSRPTFATHFRDSFLATHVRDSHSRLPFMTRVRDHTHDSRSRLPIVPPTATRYFLSRLPSCDSTTDGRTVLTPQRHLPSVPTLTLLKKIWNLLPGLASTTSYHPPSCPPPPPPVALCPLTHPLAQPPLQRPLHLLPGPLPTSPPLSHPLNHPLFPLYGSMSLMF